MHQVSMSLLSTRFVLSAVLAICAFISGTISRDAVAQEAIGSESELAAATETVIGLDDNAKAVLERLFDSIRDAKVSRATVEMLADSVMDGRVLESKQSTFQIASKLPGKYTIYLKDDDLRMRVYCNGEEMLVAMTPEAYFRMPEILSINDAATVMPLPLGPYPEPVLALSLASFDPDYTFLNGMKSISLVSRGPFKSEPAAIHLRGVQADFVTWDFWFSDDPQSPKPLRLLVDLTPMLVQSDQVHVPDGFSHQIRFDFNTWRMSGSADESLFKFNPADDAIEYESLEDYAEQTSDTEKPHPLIGKTAPNFQLKNLSGKSVKLSQLRGRVVIVDFWASWCTPCLAAMPAITDVVKRYRDKGVVLLAINTGEEPKDVKAFVKERKLKMNVLLDTKQDTADEYSVEAIPKTFVIDEEGLVRAVHQGFDGAEAIEKQLAADIDSALAK